VHDIPLVIFTVFLQAVVGMYCCLGVVRLAATATSEAQYAAIERAMLWVWPLFLIGFLASFAHLGNPENAFNVALGLGHMSPLSLEVAATSAFGGAGMAYSFLAWSGRWPGLKKPLLFLSLLLACVAIVTMSNLYLLDAVPPWNSAWTPLQFTLTASALGATGAMGLLAFVLKGTRSIGEQGLLIFGVVAVCALLVSIPAYQAWLGALDPNPDLLPSYYLSVIWLRLAGTTLGLAFLLFAMIRKPRGRFALHASAFLVLLIAEMAGRSLFLDLRGVIGL
jgi:anaerobic dimethyl sulfoxide reductase subunit C (anchor subunit)